MQFLTDISVYCIIHTSDDRFATSVMSFLNKITLLRGHYKAPAKFCRYDGNLMYMVILF